VTKNTKVCIIAAGPTWAEAPFHDKTFDFWGLNAFHRIHKDEHFTGWFQIHQPGHGEGHIDDEDHQVWLKEKHPFPIYMVKKFEEYPASVAYPIDKVQKSYCPRPLLKYFTNTVDYMVCMAMHLDYKEIRMFGTDFISDQDEEYLRMRQSLEYYMGVARGLGIKIVLPEDCALLRAEYTYGFSPKPWSTENAVKRIGNYRNKLIEEQTEEFKKYGDHKAAFHRTQGAVSAYDQMLLELRLRKRGLPL